VVDEDAWLVACTDNGGEIIFVELTNMFSSKEQENMRAMNDERGEKMAVVVNGVGR